MNKLIQEHFSDDPVFRLVTILKSINKILEKQLQRNPFFKMVIPNLSAKSLKNTCEEICILESFSVSMSKIFEIHLCEGILFFSLPYSWLYL